MQETINGSKKGLSSQTLKTIAIFAMVVDHAASAFVETTSVQGIIMHFIGRITAPIMFFLLVEGYYNTRNIFKYTKRMFLFAVISWFPFYFFAEGKLPSATSFAPFGVIYTLLLGLLALRALHEIKNSVLKTAAIIGLFVLSLFGDWQIFGLAYVLLFNKFRGDYKKQVISAVCLMLIMGFPFGQNGLIYLAINLGQILPMVLLYFYNGERGGGGKFGKWFFYVFYPVHLLVLGIIKWGVPVLFG